MTVHHGNVHIKLQSSFTLLLVVVVVIGWHIQPVTWSFQKSVVPNSILFYSTF